MIVVNSPMSALFRAGRVKENTVPASRRESHNGPYRGDTARGRLPLEEFMLVGSAVRRVAIIGGVRIPFARAHTAYANVGNQEMLTAAFRGVVDRFKLQGERLGDAAAGAVIKHSK